MTVRRTIHPKFPNQFQLISDLDQDPPVQNTWYTVFEGTGGLRIKMVAARQTNDEAAAKNIDFRMTIDGVPLDATVTAQTSASWYNWYIRHGSDRVVGDNTFVYLFHNFVAVECHDALIEMRTTTAPGTNQKLDGRVHYETLGRLPG